MNTRKRQTKADAGALADMPPPIRSMRDRTYMEIPVDSITVVNSRNRDETKFQDNVRSIKDVGQYKPIIVNRRGFSKTGQYELVCGEGRLKAHIRLGMETIKAEIVDLPQKIAHLMTLGENIARNPMIATEFATILMHMRDDGVTLAEMSNICGRSISYIGKIISLVEKGGSRLVKGVEEGILPLDFACSVAESDNRSIQHLLIDAFDSGLVRASNVVAVRKLIEERIAKSGALESVGKNAKRKMTLGQLKKEIISTTRKKEEFVHQANTKMNRIMAILMQLDELGQHEEFVRLAESQNLSALPALSGPYQRIS